MRTGEGFTSNVSVDSAHQRAEAQEWTVEEQRFGRRMVTRKWGLCCRERWARSGVLFAGCVAMLTSASAGGGVHEKEDWRDSMLGSYQKSNLRINTDRVPSTGVVASFPALGPFATSVPIYSTVQAAHYMVDVDIGLRINGSRSQTVRLVLDTGSGDLVVFGDAHCKQRDGIDHVVDGRPCFQYKECAQESASFKFNTDPTPGRRVNANCRFNVAEHQGALCREALLIDGYKAELQCEMGWDNVQFSGSSSGPSEKMIRTDLCVVNDSETATYKMRYWNNTQGTVGMFYQVCQPGASGVDCQTPYPPLLGSVPDSLKHIFSLDLNQHDKESWLHFGDPEGGWVGMEWSETQPIGLTGRSGAYSYPYAFHTFEIYHPSLCGADLLSNYSSHWTAMVDTGATCLSLPQEFFDMVLAWVPSLDCVPESIRDYDYRSYKPITVCYIREGAQASDLPTLTFKLSEDGRPLFLPLSGLVVNDRPSGRERLCINPADSVSSYQADQTIKYLLYFPKISFGTLALRNLFTAFDMKSMAIGMRSKVEYAGDGSTGLCAAQAVCVGAQSWYRAMNTCLEPPCDSLYFHEVDPVSHQCQIQPIFLACAVVTLITFTFAEIALSEIYEKLASKLMSNYAAT